MAERPEDLNLPSAVVCRIVKDALPPNTKVTKEAQAAIAKVCVQFLKKYKFAYSIAHCLTTFLLSTYN